MMKIAEVRKDAMGQFEAALYLGDVAERVKILRPVQPTLAYLTAATHGLHVEAEQIKEQLIAAGKKVPEINPNAIYLRPPVPIAQTENNWPLLTVIKVKNESLALDSSLRQTMKSRIP